MSWELVKLNDFCTFIDYRGKTPAKQAEGIPLITAKNISDRRLDFTIKEFIAEEDYDTWMTRGIPDKDDLLFTTEAPLGKVSILGIDSKVALAQRILAIRCKESGNYSKYLMYAFSFPDVWDQIIQRSSGSTVRGIRSKELKQVIIPLPPPDTQKRIVELLDRAQELIDKRKEQIELMGQLIQNLFYNMFGDPVTNPMGWKLGLLGKISNKVTDGTHKTPKYTDRGVLFLSAKNIKNNYLITETDKFIHPHEHTELIKRCNPDFGDILITKSGSTGSAAIVDTKIQFSIFESLALIKYKRDIVDGFFLKYQLNGAGVAHQYAKFSKGGTIKHLHLNELRKVAIPLPPLDLQTRFAERVQKIETQKEAMTTSLYELENNFKSLMQRAIKGEI